jgi:hypothetical protein
VVVVGEEHVGRTTKVEVDTVQHYSSLISKRKKDGENYRENAKVSFC